LILGKSAHKEHEESQRKKNLCAPLRSFVDDFHNFRESFFDMNDSSKNVPQPFQVAGALKRAGLKFHRNLERLRYIARRVFHCFWTPQCDISALQK
jgi:hypothetical protein